MKGKTKTPTVCDILWLIVNSARCFKTMQHQYLIEADINNRHELLQIGSEAFKNWATHKLSQQGYTISTEGMKNIINRLNSKVFMIDKQVEVYSRIGKTSKAIYYDLCNKNGEIVRIAKSGYSLVRSHKCPAKFIRNNNMRAQLMPKKSKDIGIFDLQKYINVKSQETFRLMLVYLVSCFIPDIAHPILISVGSHGGAKTTGNAFIKRIVDPSFADIVSTPNEERDLIVQLNKGYMHFFDNVSKIKEDFNRIFCQVCTGGYQLARKLQTDDEVVIYKLRRCLLLNGIDGLTNKADLLDRSITVQYDRISDTQIRTESELYESFSKDLPYFLNDIFNIVSQSMQIIDGVNPVRLPRMADFARWGYAIAEAMGIGGENFLNYYRSNQFGVGIDLLQSNSTAMAIIDYMKKAENWNGSVKDFWKCLDRYAVRKKIKRNDPTWAKNEISLSRKMSEIKVNLEEQGVFFTKQNVGTHKELVICYKKSAIQQGNP